MFLSRMAFVVAFLAGSMAQAITVDFEDIAASGSYTYYNNNGFTSQGFNFTVSQGFVIDSNFRYMRNYASNNGTDWLMHYSTGTMSVDLGGKLFNLTSLDTGQYRRARRSSDVVVTGTQVDGTLLTQTLTSKGQFETVEFVDWDNLVQIEFTGNQYTTYDNFVFEDPTKVPVPASLALMASVLGGLGLVGWRRKTRGC